MRFILEIKDIIAGRDFPQMINKFAGILIHDCMKVLQNIEMERGRYHLAMLVPPAAGACEQSLSQPGIQHIIDIRFLYQGVAAEYKLQYRKILAKYLFMENVSLTYLQMFGIGNEKVGIVANPETEVIFAICVPPIEECVENL